jgi:SNF2 family DNA or RNA helicase
MIRQHFIPREFGRLGTQFILDTPRCNLWAKPGMGKTSMALSALDILKLGGSKFFPALVVAPKKACELAWPGELTKWDAFETISYQHIMGPRTMRDTALRMPADLYLINYENLEWLVDKLQHDWPFKIVIADESRKLKGFRLTRGTKRAHALAHIAKHTGRWINMTGTPAPKDYTDLWGPNWFIDFGERLGRSYAQFELRHLRTNPYSRKVMLMPGQDRIIQERIADITIAFRPEDWFELEKPIYTIKEAQMPPAALKTYREMSKKYFIALDSGDSVEAMNAGVKHGKLLQIAAGSMYDERHVAHFIHDAKIELLADLIDELDEPLMVAYFFQFTRDNLLKRFPHARVLKTKKDQDDWNAGRIELLLASYGSTSQALSLQDGGRAVARFDQIWDPELREQVIERLGPVRQAQSGYKRSVLVYDLVTHGTIEHEVLDVSAGRITEQEALMRSRARSR